jgi:hypothetical protein
MLGPAASFYAAVPRCGSFDRGVSPKTWYSSARCANYGEVRAANFSKLQRLPAEAFISRPVRDHDIRFHSEFYHHPNCALCFPPESETAPSTPCKRFNIDNADLATQTDSTATATDFMTTFNYYDDKFLDPAQDCEKLIICLQ